MSSIRGSSLLLFLAFLALGCSQTPQSRFTGKWRGAPDVSGEAAQLLQSSGLQPVGDEAAKRLGNFAARQAMGVNLVMNSSGKASISDSVKTMGIAEPGEAKWELVEAEKEPYKLRITAGESVVEGTVVFRDKDAFFFSFDAPADAPTGFSDFIEPTEATEEAKTKPVTMLFRRKKYDW
jgi:hypothetical protein